MPPAGQTVIRDRPNQRWTPAEELALRRGIEKHGAGKWQQIITDADPLIGAPLSARSNVDLKDKWRNMRPKMPKTASATKRSRSMSLDLAADLPEGLPVKRHELGRDLSVHPAMAWLAQLDPAVAANNCAARPAGIQSLQHQGLSGHSALQAMVDYATAWTAARDQQRQALLLATLQREGRRDGGFSNPNACLHTTPPSVGLGKQQLGAQLRSACEQLDGSSVSAVLQAGADANAQDHEGRTPLHVLAASSQGAVAATAASVLVNLLVEHGAQLNTRDKAGSTPLHLAADAPMSAVLLAAGASVNATNNAGETPLFGAAASNQETIVRVLLQQGACMDIQDDCGETALIRACSRDDATGAALCLLEARADARIVDGAGRTALHAAAEAGSSTLVTELLLCGAMADLPDSEGDTPLKLASRNGHTQVASQLFLAMSRERR